MLIGNLCADHATFFQNTYNMAGCQAQPGEPLFHEMMACWGDRLLCGRDSVGPVQP